MNVATKLLIERLEGENKDLKAKVAKIKAEVAKLTPKPKAEPKEKAEG